jgi:hypothetical protein
MFYIFLLLTNNRWGIPIQPYQDYFNQCLTDEQLFKFAIGAVKLDSAN